MLLSNNEKLKEVEAGCWEILGDKPTGRKTSSDAKRKALIRVNESLLKRSRLSLMYLAARRDASKALQDRLLGYFDAGIEGGKREADRWKKIKYQMLIALGRVEDLKAELKGWVADDGADHSWRQAYGLLLAEEGNVDQAILQFEKIEAAAELTAGEYQLLSSWYLVADRRGDYEKATRRAVDAMSVGELNNLIAATQQYWNEHDFSDSASVPPDFDERLEFAIPALLRKETRHQGYSYRWDEWSWNSRLILNIYKQSKDFRILGGMADAMVGHSSLGVYRVLQVWQTIVKEIRDEASADTVLERIEKIRPTCNSEVDRRALDLAEAMVQWRRSTLEDQSKPHVERAIAAMKRAFEREWLPGERILMARLLSGFDRSANVSDQTNDSAQKQLQEICWEQLEQLHKTALSEPQKTRLEIGEIRAQVLWRNIPQREKAIGILKASIAEYLEAKNQPFSETVFKPAGSYIGFLQTLGRFKEAELQLLAWQTAVGKNLDVQDGLRPLEDWLETRLDRLYLDTLASKKGIVSLGSGKELYQAVYERLLKQLDKYKSGERRYAILRSINECFRRGIKIKGTKQMVKTDLRLFATDRLPVELKGKSNYREIVELFAESMRAFHGKKAATEFLLDRIDEQPRWLKHSNSNQWHYANRLSKWAYEPLGDEIEKRAKKFALAELENALRTRTLNYEYHVTTSHWNYSFYQPGSQHFFSRWKKDFLSTAEKAWEESNNTGKRIMLIAYYVNSLGEQDRAYEMMLFGYDNGLLDEDQVIDFVQLLHRQQRYAESIPILRKELKRRKTLTHYQLLMTTYYEVNKPEKLADVYGEVIAELFPENEDFYNHGSAFKLARTCQNVSLHKEAAFLLEKAVERRRKEVSGVDNNLSEYYLHLSQARTELGQLEKAIDAANAAITVDNRRDQEFESRVGNLEEILSRLMSDESPFKENIDDVIAMADRQEQESGLGNYIFRNAIGNACYNYDELEKAIDQLTQALELQPNDRKIMKRLVSCFDMQNDDRNAVDTLINLTKLNRRDTELYVSLGKRLQKGSLQKALPGEAERAYTSLVEMIPDDTEGHVALAKIRQEQDRWDEAIKHWVRVSEIRKNEPQGLAEICKANIRLGNWKDAKTNLKELKSSAWAKRFDNDLQNWIEDFSKAIKNQEALEKKKETEQESENPFGDDDHDPFGRSQSSDEAPFN